VRLLERKDFLPENLSILRIQQKSTEQAANFSLRWIAKLRNVIS
jgi:hypothetical protein